MNQEKLSEISVILRKHIIVLYENNNQDFDVERYDRITYNVVHSLPHLNITMIEKLALYYASLLYPVNHINFYSYYDISTRSILENLELNLDNDFIELVISIINYKYNSSNSNSNSNNNEWKNTLQQCIILDESHPKSLYNKARELIKREIPIFTKHTPYIKNRTGMKGLCHKSKKFNSYYTTHITSFMSYLYHTGLFLGDKIKKCQYDNKYITEQIHKNKESVIELILMFGDKEYLTIEDIDKWSD